MSWAELENLSLLLAIVPVQMQVCWYIPSDSVSISFKPEEGSLSDSSELTAGCFPLDLLGMVLKPTMFEVISGYSTSEKVLFMRERCLLVELEVGGTDSLLNTDGLLVRELQWHSESTIMMSHSQQH